MKNLKLLNKKYLLITIFFVFSLLSAQSQEPVDIWNIEGKKSLEQKTLLKNSEKKNVSQNAIYEMQSKKNEQVNIEEEKTLPSKEIEVVGLYDPDENGLDINMWSNSDGERILNLFENINKMNLSKDASEILDILLLTNSYYPKKNITNEQFLKIKSKWLLKNSNFQLIEEYLLKNQTINNDVDLTRYLVDDYLSKSELKKSCKIFSKIKDAIEDEYLSRFNIYCLINDNKKNEAQLLLDLKKELGFEDEFFEKKFNYLMGYNDKINKEISQDTILDFHLSHRTNPNFSFQPIDSTSKKIWRYLSTSNLLDDIQNVELTDFEKIATIEKATHNKNYTEEELYELYKRFQFNINQLLNIKESSKLLPIIKARALIYQGILITSETKKKLMLMNALKNSLKNDDIENAFDTQLSIFLKAIKPENVPSNFSTFYEDYLDDEKTELTKIKINNKVLHQSKLVNYFNEKTSSKKITKDLNDSLKKIKKNKKYFFSKKDIILVEALKSDGIKVSEKYNALYEIANSEMPPDIQDLIDNDEMGLALLRVVEVIGQDDLKNIDIDTIYFIINTLNQLDIDSLRNKILFKILPLKV